VAGGRAALRKGRSQKGWTLLCFFLPPLLLFLEILSSQNRKYLNGKTHFDLTPCEACNRPISSGARYCPGCGHKNTRFLTGRVSFLEVASCVSIIAVILWSLAPFGDGASPQRAELAADNADRNQPALASKSGSSNNAQRQSPDNQPISGADYIINHDNIRSVEQNSGACTVQDPDDITDMAPCNEANKALRSLSAKGICLSVGRVETWIRCMPGAKFGKIYPGKGVHFIRTDGGNSYQSEKIPDVGGFMSKICSSGIRESEPINFSTTNDPYAFKGNCYAMQVASNAHIQWLNEGTVLVLPIIPGSTGVVLKSPGHLQLGRQGVFIGDEPTQYQSALGTMETAPTFRLIVYAK